MRFLFLACSSLVLVACARAMPPEPRAVTVADAGAVARLSVEPTTPRPPTFGEAFAAMERSVRESRDGGSCIVAEYGKCDELDYIEESSGLMGDVRFFDASGKLIATQHYNIDHGGSQSWEGPVQNCGHRTIRDLCRE